MLPILSHILCFLPKVFYSPYFRDVCRIFKLLHKFDILGSIIVNHVIGIMWRSNVWQELLVSIWVVLLKKRHDSMPNKLHVDCFVDCHATFPKDRSRDALVRDTYPHQQLRLEFFIYKWFKFLGTWFNWAFKRSSPKSTLYFSTLWGFYPTRNSL